MADPGYAGPKRLRIPTILLKLSAVIVTTNLLDHRPFTVSAVLLRCMPAMSGLRMGARNSIVSTHLLPSQLSFYTDANDIAFSHASGLE